MKTIYSDKIGRNIHSPFVYRLVANVIFAPYPFYAFEKIGRPGLAVPETRDLKNIFRLVNFFRFEEVYYSGDNGPNAEAACRLARPDIQFYSQPKFPLPLETYASDVYKRLLLFDSVIENIRILPGSPEIWVITGLSRPDANAFFSGLKLADDTRITIQINQMGIAIFNRIFEKQDYVIKP